MDYSFVHGRLKEALHGGSRGSLPPISPRFQDVMFFCRKPLISVLFLGGQINLLGHVRMGSAVQSPLELSDLEPVGPHRTHKASFFCPLRHHHEQCTHVWECCHRPPKHTALTAEPEMERGSENVSVWPGVTPGEPTHYTTNVFPLFPWRPEGLYLQLLFLF